MTRENAKELLKAHRVAKAGIDASAQTIADERSDWEHMHQELAATRLQRRFRGRRIHRAVVDSFRNVLEQVVDPYSGKTKYVDLRSGSVLERKPRLFGRAEVHPDPEWSLRYDMVRQRHYYLNSRRPESTTLHMPQGFLPCF